MKRPIIKSIFNKSNFIQYQPSESAVIIDWNDLCISDRILFLKQTIDTLNDNLIDALMEIKLNERS